MSHSKKGLQPQLIRYDVSVDADALNQSLMLSVNGPKEEKSVTDNHMFLILGLCVKSRKVEVLLYLLVVSFS